MIAIEEFPAQFSVRSDTGATTWCDCRVVGLTDDPPEPQFVVLFADDGILRVMTVAEVRWVSTMS